jgi:transcriptional regulator with XRE-family HTH domain
MTTAPAALPSVGELLRDWRHRRRISQLDLAIQADISTRHLSFVETGRSRPTPEMIIRITEQLDVPLRERNTMLLAGGYAPAYPQHGFGEPELASVRAGLRRVLTAHDPNPAVLINRWWELVEQNNAVSVLVQDVAQELLVPPVNVLRISLHPDGMAPRIRNLPQWRAHLLAQLRRRAGALGDPKLAGLYQELSGYPGGEDHRVSPSEVVLPLRYQVGDRELSFFSISAVVGTAADVTVEELAIEAFYPADAATSAALAAMAAGSLPTS